MNKKRVSEKLKTPEERKTENITLQEIYIHRGDKRIKKYRNKEIKKYK